jgi:hypothetical protein
MLSKTQFKEWFDRYKYAELAATSHCGSQLSRIFSGLTTSYIYRIFFAFYSVIIGWRGDLQKNKAIQQNELQGRAFDQNVLMSLAILRFRYFIYPSVLYVLVAYPHKR